MTIMLRLMRMHAALQSIGKQKAQEMGLENAEGLRTAAKYVEDTAYDLAARVDSELISEMIIIAAELERLAKIVDHRLSD